MNRRDFMFGETPRQRQKREKIEELERRGRELGKESLNPKDKFDWLMAEAEAIGNDEMIDDEDRARQARFDR